MISVIIPTLNRKNKILQCLTSIPVHTKTEIIVLDQNKHISKNLKQYIQLHPSIIYIKTHTINKSAALNKAVTVSSGEILAFTDDDCVISKNWLDEISRSFKKYSAVACVTGNTFPYKNIPQEACQPTIKAPTALFTLPRYHTEIGYGNNFAIRKSVLRSVGLFKTWLGPGSAGSNCEDGEMILRLLTHKQKIMHNKNMIVYHDKNLSGNAYKKQQCSYVCGETACYGFYMLKKWKFAQHVIQNNLTDSYHDIKRIFGDIGKRKTIHVENWIYSVQLLCARLKGFSIGLIYFLFEDRLT